MPDFTIEREYTNYIVAGIDEAGRGPLAGPVVAAAVIVRDGDFIQGVDDSKKISAVKRLKLYEEITFRHIWSTGIVTPDVIDQINILEATKEACIMAAESLPSVPDIILVDGNMKFDNPKFKSIIKGDSKSYSIAAASIIAKVTRDKIMHQLHQEHPEYNWLKNSGYGTREHIAAIEKFGLSPHHRRSFKLK